jgi:hypothetical protein
MLLPELVGPELGFHAPQHGARLLNFYHFLRSDFPIFSRDKQCGQMVFFVTVLMFIDLLFRSQYRAAGAAIGAPGKRPPRTIQVPVAIGEDPADADNRKIQSRNRG